MVLHIHYVLLILLVTVVYPSLCLCTVVSVLSEVKCTECQCPSISRLCVSWLLLDMLHQTCQLPNSRSDSDVCMYGCNLFM